MAVLIYGGGAVGLGIASCLLKANQDVTIVTRAETAARLQVNGIARTGIFGDLVVEPGSFGVIKSIDELEGERFEHVLVCIKSFDSEDAARDIHAHKDLLSDTGCIVLFQNGWGNAEVFTRYFAQEMVYNARVITGFRRLELNRVEVTVHAEAIHVGSLYAGELARVVTLCDAINKGGISCKPTRQIERDLWAKMLFNCPLNALGAILGVSYGALGESEWARRAMKLIIDEVFMVMEAAGYRTYWNSTEAYQAAFYGTLIPSTAEHFSSTLQDLQAGKRTEIDALNGAVVDLGKTYGLAVQTNEAVCQIIKFLQGKS
jgi:2-dehydropantoate 2-reductase